MVSSSEEKRETAFHKFLYKKSTRKLHLSALNVHFNDHNDVHIVGVLLLIMSSQSNDIKCIFYLPEYKNNMEDFFLYVMHIAHSSVLRLQLSKQL